MSSGVGIVTPMAELSRRERSRLPDSAFAYVDSKGGRKLPIHDESHVRNALARFERVAFEDDAARERARKRLLNAAKKYGIVPVGFITGQFERLQGKIEARSTDAATLPTGFVTFLLTDIESSTALLRHLGDRYAELLNDVRGVVRAAVVQAGGREVDAHADEFFAVFEQAAGAIEAAAAIQLVMCDRTWPDDVECRIRVGIHSGRPSLTPTGYIGLSVHTAARICWAAHGGQIVVSADAKQAAEGSLGSHVGFRSLGRHRLPGLAKAEALFQVESDGLPTDFPRLRRQARPRTVKES
jgi:class 3 adenylate cyclase